MSNEQSEIRFCVLKGRKYDLIFDTFSGCENKRAIKPFGHAHMQHYEH